MPIFLAGLCFLLSVPLAGGGQWVEVNRPDDTEILSLNIAKGTLFAQTEKDCFFSTDNGRCWAPVASRLPVTAKPHQIVVSGKTVYVGTDRGLFASDDAGGNWTAMASGLPVGEEIWVQPFGSGLRASSRKTQFFSTDGGVTWTIPKGCPAAEVSTYFELTKTNLVVDTPQGLFITKDGGANWRPIKTDFLEMNTRSPDAAGEETETTYYAFVIGTSLFISTRSGSFRSTDYGKSWKRVVGLPNCFPLLSGEAVDHAMFAVFFDYWGIYLSKDGGATWKSLDSPCLNGSDEPHDFTFFSHLYTIDRKSLIAVPMFCNNVLIYDRNGRVVSNARVQQTATGRINHFEVIGKSLVACCWDGGVYVSTDSGRSWESVNEGLTDLSITSLTWSKGGAYLFAGSSEGVLWRLPIVRITLGRN